MSPVAQRKGDPGACDRIASQLVRMRGACQYPDCGTPRDLQCCHIIGRAKCAALRTDLGNLLCLCATHHALIDSYPDEKLMVTAHVFGPDAYQALRERARVTLNQRFDWKAEKARLEALRKQYGDEGWRP